MHQQALNYERIKSQARNQLEQNWTGEYYAPHLDGAFPDNFLWDTCFVAMGLAEDEPMLAATQMVQLMRYQWPNGMIANQNVDTKRRGTIIERLNFQTDKSPDAPENQPTSGFSQPPMIAEATWTVAQSLPAPERQRFLDVMLPGIITYHQWLFDERDINGDGLLTQIHPYETGMDNTPPYEWLVMDSRSRSERLLTSRVMMGVFGPALGALRRDFKHADPEHRMHNASVAQYQLLVRKLARHRYDINSITADRSIPIVEDVTFNSIFMRANARLIELAGMSNQELPTQLKENIARQRTALDHLWDPNQKTYFSRNARTKELIKIKTIGSLMPLYATTLEPERRDHLVDDLIDPRQFWTRYPVPSVPCKPAFDAKARPLHDPNRYWGGASWLWMNGLLTDGLERNSEPEIARTLRQKSLRMFAHTVRKQQKGASEYYNPHTGEGIGVFPFSAAAAWIMRFADIELAKALY